MTVADLFDEWLADSGRTTFDAKDMLAFGTRCYDRGTYNPARCGDCGGLAHKENENCPARDEAYG